MDEPKQARVQIRGGLGTGHARAPRWEAPAASQAPYDVIVFGASLTGLCCAWRLAEAGRRVAVIGEPVASDESPGIESVGEAGPTGWPLWFHPFGLAPGWAGHLGAAAAQFDAWSKAGVVSGRWLGRPVLALASTMDGVNAMGGVAAAQPSVKVLDAAAAAQAHPAIRRAAILSAWDDHGAAVFVADDVRADVTAAAIAAGAHIFEGVAVGAVSREGGWSVELAGVDGAGPLQLSAGQVVDTTVGLAVTGALRPAATSPLAAGLVERWLVTEPQAPLLDAPLRVDGIDVAQLSTGHIIARQQLSGTAAWCAEAGVASLAAAAASLCEVLPALHSARLYRSGVVAGAVRADGEPVVGASPFGAWWCGGFGGSEAALAPVLGADLAASVLSGALVGCLERYGPVPAEPAEPAERVEPAEGTLGGQRARVEPTGGRLSPPPPPPPPPHPPISSAPPARLSPPQREAEPELVLPAARRGAGGVAVEVGDRG